MITFDFDSTLVWTEWVPLQSVTDEWGRPEESMTTWVHPHTIKAFKDALDSNEEVRICTSRFRNSECEEEINAFLDDWIGERVKIRFTNNRSKVDALNEMSVIERVTRHWDDDAKEIDDILKFSNVSVVHVVHPLDKPYTKNVFKERIQHLKVLKHELERWW